MEVLKVQSSPSSVPAKILYITPTSPSPSISHSLFPSCSSMARSLTQALNKTTSNNPRLLPTRNHSTFPEPPVIYHGYKDPNGIKKCEPDWLPLRPGFSYWAPPDSNSIKVRSPIPPLFAGEVMPASSMQHINRSSDDDKSN